LKNAGEVPVNSKCEYVELKNWWKTHKNSLKREANDMTPMDFNNKTSWGVMTDAIIAPKSVEGRQYWSEINNYKLGMTKEKQFGYQYLLGENFPVIFKK
tara:strand:+ start:500 stop:796 length:297 start_codon:yes stop_codon:yes gene_type:complete